MRMKSIIFREQKGAQEAPFAWTQCVVTRFVWYNKEYLHEERATLLYDAKDVVYNYK